jgi:hypothetical protein
MPKSSANVLFVTAFFKPKTDQLAYPVDPIIEDAAASLDAALTAAPDDEAMTVILEDWLAARPHLLKSVVPIPPDDIEVACMSLAKRGELVKRYGLASVESALKARGVSLSEIKPGRDADDGDAKRKRKADDAPVSKSQNPWHPDWKSSRPTKSPAEKEALRLEAQTAIIRSFGTAGATRYARSAGMTLAGTPLRK